MLQYRKGKIELSQILIKCYWRHPNKKTLKILKCYLKDKNRPQSTLPEDENKAYVTVENNPVYANDSSEFKSTLSYNSPFLINSSYRKSFQNIGPCKWNNYITL